MSKTPPRARLMAISPGEKPSSSSQTGEPLAGRPWEGLPPSLATALRADVPATVEEIIDAIRRSVPAYALPLEGAFGENIRAGVERALGDFLDEIEGRPPPADAAGRDTYAGLGRVEAREGRTMEALLAAYRVGARVSWRRASLTARDFPAEVLALLAESVFAYIDELAARSAQGYAEERSQLEGQAARRRRALMRLLVSEPAADPGTVEAAAREAGWEPPVRVSALVWSDASEQPVARRLPLGCLVAPLEEGLICALVPDAEAPGRPAELERALGRRRGALGDAVAPLEAARSARRARALALLIAGEAAGQAGGVLAAGERLADLIVFGDRELAEELARTRLEPLADRSDGSRRRLIGTLAAWLDHQGNVPQVAQALHVHPQTVRYRVAQLREAFGPSLEEPDARFELALAVRAAARYDVAGA